MNNAKASQNDKLEKLLRKAHLPEPSPKLKDRIAAEATRIWGRTSVELSWRIPIRRLVASAAAAVFVAWLANFSSDSSLVRWQTHESSAMTQQPPKLDVLSEMPYGPYVKHLTSIRLKLPTTDGSGLRHYVETVRKLLDEVQQNDVSKPPDPLGGRSRLYPDRSSPSSYS
jgi:hypothetical protein